MADKLAIEVVYGSELETRQLTLEVNQGTIEEIIVQSGILSLFPEINLSVNKVGVYGEIRSLNDKVEDGDRIEIYRPIKIDPKQARRERAKK